MFFLQLRGNDFSLENGVFVDEEKDKDTGYNFNVKTTRAAVDESINEMKREQLTEDDWIAAGYPSEEVNKPELNPCSLLQTYM